MKNERQLINTSVSSDDIMMELDSSAACFACNNNNIHLYSADSILICSSALEASLVILKYLLSHVTYMAMSLSFISSDPSINSTRSTECN